MSGLASVQVRKMGTPTITPAHGGILQRAAVNSSPVNAVPLVGGALDAALRQDMESRFVHDFSQVQVHSFSPGVTTDLSQQIQAESGGGNSLDSETQRKLETGLGVGLAGVRVHTDGKADHLARSVEATAFTTGQDIFFRSGAYDPRTSEGQRLLAHEVTHTVQQSAGPVAGTLAVGGVCLSDPSDSFEQQAKRTANAFMSGLSAPDQHSAPPMQRKTGISGPKTLQRDWVETKAPNWGTRGTSNYSFIRINPSASISATNVPGASQLNSFKGHAANATFNLLPGSVGQLTYSNSIFWFQDNYDPAHPISTFGAEKNGNIPISVTIQFSVSADGKVQFVSQPVKNGGGGEPGLLDYKAESSISTSGDGDATLSIQESLVALSTASVTKKSDTAHTEETHEETSTHGKGGGEVEIKGTKIGAEVDITKSSGSGSSDTRSTGVETGQSTSGGLNWLFGHSVVLKGIKPKVKGSRLSWLDVRFKKREGQIEIEDEDKGKIAAFLIEFPEKDLLLSGKVKIKVIGHASAPGTFEKNQEVAGKRIDAAAKEIHKFNPDIGIERENQAKFKSTEGATSNEELAEDRYVELQVFVPGELRR